MRGKGKITMKNRILSLVLGMAIMAGTITSAFTPVSAAAADPNAPSAFQTALTEKYADPDRVYSTDIRWWIGDAANTDEALLDEIQALYDAGFRGVELCMQNDRLAPDDVYAYGSEMWSHKWKLMMNKLLDLGMGVYLTSGTNWATSNVPGLDPDSQAAMQNVALGTVEVAAGQTLENLPTPRTMRSVAQFVTAYAYRLNDEGLVDTSTYIPLTEATEGETVWAQTVNWTAPDDGTYRVFALWSQGTAQSASPSQIPSYATNYFDARGIEALQTFWNDHYFNDPELVAKIAEGDVQLFMDSLEINPATGITFWCEDMAELFMERKNYDIRPYLFLLDGVSANVRNPYHEMSSTYGIVDDSQREKIVNDYLEVMTDVYRERMLVPLKEWLNSYGIKTRAQISYGRTFEISEPAMDVDYPEAENLNQYNQIDIFRLWTGASKLENKVLSTELSAPPMAYAYTAQKHLEDAYASYAAGFQRAVWHIWAADYGYGDSSGWPGFSPGFGKYMFHFFGTRNPGYKDYDELNAHLGRVQQLVQTGESRTDIGFIHNNWTQGIRFGGGTGNDLTAMNWMLAHQGIYYRSTELQDNGYTYDYFSPDFLFDDDVYFNTETQTIEKAGYKALVLYQNWLDVKGAERILEWAKQGLKVVVMENAAVRTPFNDGSDEQLASIMTELKSLPTVRVAEIYDASEGFRYEDQVAEGYEDNVYEMLQELGVRPYAEFIEPNHQLLTQSRQDEDGNMYLYAYNYCTNDYHQNSHIESVQGEDHGTNIQTEIKMDGQYIPYEINSWTGEVTEVGEYRYENGQTIFPIDLDYNNIALYAFEEVQSEKRHVVSTDAASAYVTGNTVNIRANESGTYTTTLNDGTIHTTDITVPAAYDITGWDVNVESWEDSKEIKYIEETMTLADGSTLTTVNGKTPTKKTNISAKLDTMTTWDQIPEVGMDVSGIATYEATFNWDAKAADGAMLDLGDTLVESLEVYINGTKVGGVDSAEKPGTTTGGVSMTKPVADISKYLKDGENTIKIIYASTLTNELLSTGEMSVQINRENWWHHDVDYSAYGPSRAVIAPYVDAAIANVTVEKGILGKVLAYAQQAAESEEFENVIASVQKSFTATLESAETVYADPIATQQEVDDAWKALMTEIHKLGFIRGDKTSLSELIELAESFYAQIDKYTPVTAEPFTSALTEAKAVKEDGDAMQDDVTTAESALLEAMMNLRYRADKSVLESVLAKASEIDAAAYTAQSVAAFNAANEEAKAVNDNDNATQAEVNDAADKLSAAIDGLIAAEAQTTTTATGIAGTTNAAKSPATGETLPIAAGAVLMVCAAAIAFSRKRK